MPVSSAAADPYTTDPSGEPREDTVPAEYKATIAALLALLAAYLAPKPGLPGIDWAARVGMLLPRFRVRVGVELDGLARRVLPLLVDAVQGVHASAVAAAARDARWAGPLPTVPGWIPGRSTPGAGLGLEPSPASSVNQVTPTVPLPDVPGGPLPGGIPGQVPSAASSAHEALLAAHDKVRAVLEDTYRRAVAAAGRAPGDPSLVVQRILDDLARRGVTGYTDRAGRRWSLETYVETVVRAHLAEAALDGYLAVCSRAGVRFLVVSYAAGACKRCVPWERKTLSIDGTPAGPVTVTEAGGYRRTIHVAGTLAEARAAGLLHPWCRHRLSAWSPGRWRRLADRAFPDRVARAQERYVHRTARAWERRQAVAQTTQAKAVAASRVSRWRRNRRNR